jgi:hypothetical protein
MKINVFENDQVFGFNLIAENLKDAAWITRFQLNVKRDIPVFNAYAKVDGNFVQCFSFRRKSDHHSEIGR